MRRIMIVLAAMAAMVVVYAGAAWAASVSEVEPNDSIAQAQNIEGWFDLSENPDIFDSTTIPHATRSTARATIQSTTMPSRCPPEACKPG